LAEEPIRSEIFSVERLKQHAESLATAQEVTNDPREGYNLSRRLKDNKKILSDCYQVIGEAVSQKQAITSAAEWLIDNFHIIEGQLRDISEHLPIGFYRELPKLAEGYLKGYPRVYGLSWAFVAHTDSRFDPELLTQFVRSYQNIQPLTIGELWAIAITLRVILIENLRHLSAGIVSSLQARKAADKIADELLGLDGGDPKVAEAFLHSLGSKQLRKPFLVQLIQRLRYQDPSVTPALSWLNEKLLGMGVTSDEIVALEHNNQSAANVTVRNIITSMRLISAFDWRAFFDSVSLVDSILRSNPVFATVDFTTQDYYRHTIEELAKGSNYTELDIAKLVISKTEKYKTTSQLTDKSFNEKKADPGYYLISSGRRILEDEINFTPTFRRRFLDFYISHAKIGYISTILVLTFALLAVPVFVSWQSNVTLWGLILLSISAFFPASDIVVAFLNRFVVIIVGPRYLPRIKLSNGVPDSLSTFVVVPILLINKATVEEHLDQLEVHYLSNPDGVVHFALLSDWKDSDKQNCPEDSELLDVAAQGIEKLNFRYGHLQNGKKRFFLFHRERNWNPSEKKWMGWERKRGKLHEFNCLLRGATNTTHIFLNNEEELAIPQNIKYVITLDADTRMPIGMVNHLVGTMAHPLNRPRFDSGSSRVVDGYGILQPRIMSSLPSRSNSSIFQRLFSGPCGIDPYTFAVSDIYQDLFEEATYAGKGIYDVDVFEAALKGRTPENALLSHDLFEGIFVRCGFVSNLEFFEDFPSHTEVSASRMDRWTRGDWQLLPWICGSRGKSIPFIGRWKMIDNLRRTLSAPAMILTLILGWFLPQTPYVCWTAFILTALVFPSFLPFLSGFISHQGSKRNLSQLRISLTYDFLVGFQQTLLLLSLLLYHATLMCDSILRTLYRLTISKSNLLKWVTVAQEKNSSNLDLNYFFKRQRMSVVFAVALGASFLLFKADNSAMLAAPFIFLWILSPAISWFVSLPPIVDPVETLTQDEISSFRLIARKTWRFFTTFVTEEDSFLPPDNFQEDPEPTLAHRTSPTNFGLYLLSILAAKDFGWIGIGEMTNRLESTLEVLKDLPRYKGHFYNWYESRTKQPLEPRYISSVDSGNFAGHLLVVSETCKESLNFPLLAVSRIEGIQDTLKLLKESLLNVSDKRRSIINNLEQLQSAVSELEELLKDFPEKPFEFILRWEELQSAADTVFDIAKTVAQERGEVNNSEVLFWALEVHSDVKCHLRDYNKIFSWANLLDKYSLPPDLTDDEKKQIDLLNSKKTLEFSLTDLCSYYQEILKSLKSLSAEEGKIYINKLIHALEISLYACELLIQRLVNISELSRELFNEMNFKFLFDSTRNLFSIGFNVSDNSLDPSYYDMLASEARLASFVAVAKGEVPTSHWFSLSRALTPVGNGAALLSWSGSMFEYLMPSLVMYTPRGSLLDRTCRLIVQKQVKYGSERSVPWGISESAYNIRDLNFTYQYSSFGVPGLGLKRGLGQNLVISPYSTALAAMYSPKDAQENFKLLKEMKTFGSYGFYEALDFTTTRLPENKKVVIVRTYMAHHQGMSLVALDNVLHDGIMRHRFHNVPEMRSAELLLQERTPRNIAVTHSKVERLEVDDIKNIVEPPLRRFNLPHLPVPSTHLLSNGHYTVMLTSAGSGYSRWDDLSVTRWREDVTSDMWGSYIFLYDTESKKLWSAGYQPTGVKPDYYEATFSEDRARIVREDGGITTSLEVVVSAEDNAEIRRVSLRNTGLYTREIEITSYGEVVLAPQGADIMHPAFSNLFVQTEYIPEVTALIATRRLRSLEETPVWMAHVIAVEEDVDAGIEYETDRARFLGRGNSIRKAVSVVEGHPLSNTVGAVLDPIVSLRTRIRIPPGVTKHVSFSTIVAHSRDEILDLADKYHDPATFERASTLAWTHAQVQLYYLGIDSMEANFFQHLANRIIYSNPSMRPSSKILKRNTLSVSGLWPYQISGDNPILVVHIDNADDQATIKQLLRAHEYWRMKRLVVDLVIINEKATSYVQDLQVLLETMVRASLRMSGSNANENSGKIFVLRSDLLTQQEKELLETAARSVMSCKEGSLSEQILRIKRNAYKPVYQTNHRIRDSFSDNLPTVNQNLEFFNGLGGFANNGSEYVIILGKLQYTPAPWINVIANNEIGFLVSESGSGYTWSLNSRENQLTPWSNDPVSDPSSEVFYICDEETGELWTPTASPIRFENTTYIARHGQGYSCFEHLSHGIESKLVQYVSFDDPIKISHLTLENKSQRIRQISVTAYVEWILGSSRSANAPFIVTEIDEDTNAMFAYNHWNLEFGKRVAFADFCKKQTSWTGDRTEFVGRNGTLEQPASLVNGDKLSGNVGAGLDPCCAQHVILEILPGQKIELFFFLGQVEDREIARKLINKYRECDLNIVLDKVKENWNNILSKVQVKTPDRKTDLMLNRWLLYQTLVCRYWARTAFYQAGGAYGFRDQLQDVMALLISQPALVRMHILKAAKHQFVEGDVQHWWHPPLDRGVRTKCSDDSLWLPYVVHQYVKVTGDYKILDETIPFLEGRMLSPEEESAYYQPTISEQSATLFEHCKRTLDRSLKVGAHGLPFIGSCDWNDGMNRVGHQGLGESVWLGWFLHSTLTKFSDIAKKLNENESAKTWIKHADNLKKSLEKEAWDGAWYRRAYFDDGTPLGSASSAECRIDSIAQSWSVISKAADKERSLKAMESVEKYLIRPGDNLSLLFTPPFDKTPLDPGYIKGYLPGIRENGSQYTHAAIWNVIAFNMLGNGNKAYELFSILNPINHANSRAGVHRYKVEPYVIAADIYSEPPHVGRGGWTWYTGSSGWMYRAGIEWILGLNLEGNILRINPSIPDYWQGFTISYKHESTQYEISVENPNSVSGGVKIIELDGKSIIPVENGIPLIDDKQTHIIKVVLG
jgi:cyclic beta-1,2-glucan synthetase